MSNSVLVSVKKHRRIRDACNCIASFIKRWEQDEAFRTHKRRFGRENLPALSWLSSLLVPTQVRSRKGIGRFLDPTRSEEHTSELQSRRDLVCRLLLEKKKEDDVVICSVTAVVVRVAFALVG